MPSRSARPWSCATVALSVALLFAQAVAIPWHAASPAPDLQPGMPVAPAQRAAIASSYGRLPLSFEVNAGQDTDSAVRFLAHSGGVTLALSPSEAVLSLTRSSPPPAVPHDRFALPGQPDLASATRTPSPPPTVLDMAWLGANPHPTVTGEDPLPGTVNYFLGNDPAKWHTNIPTYQQVRLHDVYPGIDLVYYGTAGQLEYDFVVAPGADPAHISLGFTGAQDLGVDLQGNLSLALPGGTIAQQKPLVYQMVGGLRQAIAGGYTLASGTQRVGFALGAYNPRLPLVIDPVFIYSTYLGGSTASFGNNDFATGIAVDASGNAYVTGGTAPYSSCGCSNSEVFISKLNTSGSALVYATYLGGNGDEVGNSIAVDTSGNAYLTGFTNSSSFPTVNPLQGTPGGAYDAFVSELNPSGSALIYSTYLGGSGNDQGNGIAVDSGGNAYVTGQTNSANFPTANPEQTSIVGQDAFVSKLNASGSALVYSTYLGGSGIGQGNAIAIDSGGNAYITGTTNSTNFPVTSGALQMTTGGGQDAFVSKLNASGSALVYSTYLGGNVTDQANAIAVDSGGNAYITGTTSSTNFPTVGALQTSVRYWDAFVSKLNASGSALVYSTYLGGGGVDIGYGIVVDNGGRAYLTGDTASGNFPLASPVQAVFAPGSASNYGVFVSELDAAGHTLLFSTYVVGSDNTAVEHGYAIAMNGSKDIYVAGAVVSGINYPVEFPTTVGVFEPRFLGDAPGDGDAFVARLQPNAAQRNPTAGVYRSASSTFYLRNINSTGSPDFTVTYGANGDLPVMGDWTGKGYDSVGVYRPSNSTFYLRNTNTTGPSDLVVTFGANGDLPVVGDWTGKGYDSVGVYRPSTRQFLLRNSNTTGNADITLTYGMYGAVPLVGDWSGQGKTTIGVYLAANTTFYLRNTNTTGPADITLPFGGIAGQVPVTGDWLSQGRDTLGYFNPSDASWHLRYLTTAGAPETQFAFGASGDIPLAGQWTPGGLVPPHRPNAPPPPPHGLRSRGVSLLLDGLV